MKDRDVFTIRNYSKGVCFVLSRCFEQVECVIRVCRDDDFVVAFPAVVRSMYLYATVVSLNAVDSRTQTDAFLEWANQGGYISLTAADDRPPWGVAVNLQ